MKDREHYPETRSYWGFLAWPFYLALFYLLSTGPMTRWFPAVADTIYAPLSPLVKNGVLGPPIRVYLALWGVK